MSVPRVKFLVLERVDAGVCLHCHHEIEKVVALGWVTTDQVEDELVRAGVGTIYQCDCPTQPS